MEEHREIVVSVAYELMMPQSFKVPNLIKNHTFQKFRNAVVGLV